MQLLLVDRTTPSLLHLPKLHKAQHCHNQRSYIRASSSTASSKVSLENNGLPPGLVRDLMPKHVALVMDGNRRWCKSKGIDISYAPLYDTAMRFGELCAQWDIPVVTFFNFATLHWNRPRELIHLICQQFQDYLENNLEQFRRSGMRISVIGELSKLPKVLQETIKHVEEETKNHTRIHLIFAVSYGGRRDILQATRKIAEKVKDGVVEPKDIDEALIENELWTNISGWTIPDPDFLIRTGGILRMSDFLIWKMPYTDLYFTNVYWPDFGEVEFIKALRSFQQRERQDEV